MDNIFCIILTQLVMVLITSNQASSNSTTFNASIQLFDDANFVVLHNNGNRNYRIGQDTIYIEVIMPDNGRISSVEINNVFICTMDGMNDLSQTVNETNEGIIGCLSPLIDIDGPYNIISNDNTTQTGQDYEATIIENSYINVTNSNRVRFSFLTFNIGRTIMNIHVELTLQLQNDQTTSLSLQTHTQIDLFLSSIIGVEEDSNIIQLDILTQSADYLVLSNPVIVNTSTLPVESINELTQSCLIASAYTCAQIFKIKIKTNSCGYDLRGSYDIKFDVVCINNNDSLCTTFLKDNNGDQVILSFESNIVDLNPCPGPPQISNKSITFYDDEHFLVEHNANEGYMVAHDTIFVEVQVNGHYVNDVKLDDVFICASADDIDGGCLSSLVNVTNVHGIILDGSTIQNEKHREINIIENPRNGTRARFSFLAFDIGGTTIHIHIQLIVTFYPSWDPFHFPQMPVSISSKTYVVTNNIMVTNTNIISTSITDDNNNNSATTSDAILSFIFVFVICCVSCMNV